jgi:hypothetical protein
VSQWDRSFGTTFAMENKHELWKSVMSEISVSLAHNTCQRIRKGKVKISGSTGYQTGKRGIESADDLGCSREMEVKIIHYGHIFVYIQESGQNCERKMRAMTCRVLYNANRSLGMCCSSRTYN